MKKQHGRNLLLVSLLITSGIVSAAPGVKISGTIPVSVQLTAATPNDALALGNASTVNVLKRISLEKIELSPEAATFLANTANKPATTLSLAATNTPVLPPSAAIGMNNLPVLDQGQHGTCVTFADTAALDAVRGNTDYISQLCNLELGAYLEAENAKTNIEYPSGWEGSWNEIVLGQIEKYGIITMTYQKQYGCGNAKKTLKEYPLLDQNNTGVPMSEADFSSHNEQIMKDMYWRTLLNSNDAFSTKAKMDVVIDKVKQSIVDGHRVVFGTLVDVNGNLESVAGAVGTYHNVANDSWIMTAKIKKDLAAKRVRAGHAMIVTAYDDNAEITGADGTRHKGVFTLRNSWSKLAGDKGDYYMSYEYFKTMVMETQEISPTPFA